MERSSSADASPSSLRRARGRPRREAIERENLSKMLNSNLTNDVSRRFLQKLNLLKVINKSILQTEADFDQ
jgi:ribosomal protein S18 acetylase RimI-like enzyme